MTTPRKLSARYELGEILGFGGMSEVHLARDLRLGRDVAIKVLRADLARDPTFYLRFRREAQNAAALNHPAIVAVYDTGEAEDPHNHIPVPYIVMELLAGRHGTPWSHAARHMLGLRHGQAGSRRWRQVWSDHRMKTLAPREVSRQARAALGSQDRSP